MPSHDEVTIEIPMDQGDYLGAELNVQLVVVRIQPGTLAQDKLQVTACFTLGLECVRFRAVIVL